MFIGSNIHVGTLALRGSGAVATSYLLDTYPAFAAYSTRQIGSGLNCMIVTEAGGGTEAIIGFADGWLDEAAVASHCGASTGSVAQWYDQERGAYHMVQAVDGDQPRIYSGAAVDKVNSKPAVYFQGGGQGARLATSFTPSSQPNTVFSVVDGSGTDEFMFDGIGELFRGYINAGGKATVLAGGTLSTLASIASHSLLTFLINSTSSEIRVNGSVDVTGDAGTNSIVSGLTLGARNATTDPFDYQQEFILYDSDQTANFSAIEADINAAFSVYA